MSSVVFYVFNCSSIPQVKNRYRENLKNTFIVCIDTLFFRLKKKAAWKNVLKTD